MFDVAIAIGLTLLGIFGWAANVLGMPGNWLTTLAAWSIWWFAPADFRAFVGLPAALVILVIAIFGEALEFASSALGTSRLGGSKLGTTLALAGSVLGAITGLVVGSPIPVIGNVVASLLLGGAGACAGAVLGERWAGKDWRACVDIGNAAFWGRILGTVGKVVCGTIATAVFLIAVWVR